MKRDTAETSTTSTSVPQKIPETSEEIQKVLEQEFDNLYPTYSWDDIENYKHNADDDLVGTKGLGLISKGGSFMLIGPTGHGKSVMMQQWAVSMAAGISILGKIEVHQAIKILYYQSDNQLSDMHIDFPSIREHLKVSKECLKKNLIVRRVFSESGSRLKAILEYDIKKHKPNMVIMDNYQSFIDGDINSTGVFQEWRMAVEPMMSKYKIALIVVAHTTKKTQYDNKNVINPSDSVYLASGTAALANWVRTSAWLSMDAQAPVGFYKLVLGKNWQRAGLGKDAAGSPIRELKVEHSRNFLTPYWSLSDNQGPTPRIKDNSYEKVVKLYKENPLWSHEDLGKSVYPVIERTTVCKHLKRAKEEGLITGNERKEAKVRATAEKFKRVKK